MQIQERAIPARVFEAIRGFYLARSSGTLEIGHPGGTQRLFFRAGELYLGPGDPLVVALATAVPDGYGAGGVAHLLQAMSSWSPAEVRLTAAPPEDLPLAGPLPTALLLMEGATRGRSEDELVAMLGGVEARLAARGNPAAILRLPALEPEDAFLLSRLEQPMALKDLLHQGSLERRAVLVRLGRLRALDLLATADEKAPQMREAILSEKVLERFQERVGTDLSERPLDLPAPAHRLRIAELLRDCGGMTHYELLGLALDAPPELVFRSFQDLARVVHPAHAARLDLAGGDVALRLLFERATEAYLTLSDAQRRSRYDVAMGLSVSDAVAAEGRREERRRVAERNYQMAAGLVGAEEFHFAIELLHQAVVLDPQADYYLLLARCLARNPNWTNQAIDACRAGLRLDTAHAGLHMHLGQIFERGEQAAQSAAEYVAALDALPDQSEALAGLERLAAQLGTSRDTLIKRVRSERRGR